MARETSSGRQRYPSRLLLMNVKITIDCSVLHDEEHFVSSNHISLLHINLTVYCAVLGVYFVSSHCVQPIKSTCIFNIHKVTSILYIVSTLPLIKLKKVLENLYFYIYFSN